ncbi:MAG: F0F1 ATP synthase subunit B [Coleofasciculaceae cyanobacterium SM2_1_6]|nr:F0F1 ATP synthase subunit B [Coleofasciculaceae cyanobacterium SM2_1_6]
MESFLLLATEAAGEIEGGFGLNFDIFESNLINLLIIIGALFYFGRNFLGNILSERKKKIVEAIADSESRVKAGASALAEAQQNLAQAQLKAAQILKDAEVSAQAAKEAILLKASQDVEKLKVTAVQDLNAEREKAIAQLRSRVAALALAQVETDLQNIDSSAQQNLIDRSIALLGGRQ